MSSNVKQVIYWILGAVVVLGLILGIAISTTSKSTNSTVTNDTKPASTDWNKGNLQAKAQLIEYSDFECPACSGYEPKIKQLTSEFGDKIVLSYRHFPLKTIHKNAERAAWAAEAAGAQGKFWEMHDKLFDTQSQWADESDPLNRFVGYAKDLGLNEEQFKNDFNSPAIHKKIDDHVAAGNRAGVDATPTLFLNGKKLELPRTYEELRDIVKKELGE